MKKVYSKIAEWLFSMELMGALMFCFALSVGVATFIENDFGTPAAWKAVYNSWWLELILLLLSINLIGSIFTRKYYRKGKIGIFVFHFAFFLIVLGSAITRYFGFEGSMRIRENNTQNQMILSDSYFHVRVQVGEEQYHAYKKAFFTNYGSNKKTYNFSVGDKSLKVRTERYIPNAVEVAREVSGGKPLIRLMALSMNSREDLYIPFQEVRRAGNVAVGFEVERNDIAFLLKNSDSGLVFKSPFVVYQSVMMSRSEKDTLPADTYHIFEPMKLYEVNGQTFVLANFYNSAEVTYESSDMQEHAGFPDVIMAEVSSGSERKDIVIRGKPESVGDETEVALNGMNFKISFGAKFHTLPFAIKLNDFQLDRYPGSSSPSSYASEVTVIDSSRQHTRDFRIYMNHILQYRGYRFYQSSYDNDEKGTILSVNHDFLGTAVTYFGYFLMTLGMVVSLFNRKSRFWYLYRRVTTLRNIRVTRIITGIVLLLFSALVTAQNTQTETNIKNVDRRIAAEFGKLLVQEKDGRIHPLNTLTDKILLKMCKKNRFNGMNSDQIILAMSANPDVWMKVPIIKIADKQIAGIVGLEGKFATFNQIVDFTLAEPYKLGKLVQEAYARKASERTRLDHEIINVDERVNVAYMVFRGDFLKFFPKPGNDQHPWYAASDEAIQMPHEDSLFVRFAVGSLFKAVNENNLALADSIIQGISQFQIKYGGSPIPSASVQKVEILYNKLDIFNRLFQYYGVLGVILIVLFFTDLFGRHGRLKIPVMITTTLVFIGFIFHTLNLAARWYVSGHAPWSNGYESMIFVGWATLLAGFVFSRRSIVTIAATTIIAALIMFVSHLSWMNPEITNLVPVLKSYWLLIHVAVITSSYGFFALGTIMGLLTMILMIIRNKNSNQRISNSIEELLHVNEMTIIIGLYLLTIGTFLGAVWANESWGRYWAWDPKETWALISVIIYAFVAHMRMIPGLRGDYAFTLASVISFSAILMTYFGVNYYLGGMHSYAKGDPVPVPTFVYYTVGIVFILSLTSYFKNKQFEISQGISSPPSDTSSSKGK